MHPYGIDSNERRNVLIVLVILSLLSSEAFGRSLAAQGWLPPAPLDWLFDPASAAAWFAAFFYLFEHYVWRWGILHEIRFVQLPDLNGLWTGTLRSSYDSFSNAYNVDITIKQSWTRLIVELTTAQSSSKSDTGSVFVDKAAVPVLVYTYLNTPNPTQLESMAIHAGTTTLELKEAAEGLQLVGHYYNGRGRGNFGEIIVVRSNGTATVRKLLPIFLGQR